jgi:hypothetical protein
MFRGSESRKPAKEEVAYIHCQHFINYIFFIVEVDFGK